MEPISQDEVLRAQEIISLGKQAKEIMRSDMWTFFHDRILKALEREAIRKMKSAKTELERLEAQQMLLASEKPKLLLEAMISEAETAYEVLSRSQSPKEATYE